MQGRWSRAEHIYTNIILKHCGGFWFFSPLELWGHISKPVHRITLICTGETTQPLNFLSLLPTDWGSPSLGAPWANAQAWHMQEQHTARVETLIHCSKGSPHLYPEAVKPGHLTGKGKQECLQTGTTKGHCTSVHTSKSPQRSESSPSLSFWPLPNFKLAME